MHSHIRCAIGAALLCSASAAGEVVFSQGPLDNEADVGLGFFSHTAPTPTNSFRHADNFTLDADTPITAVRWWGSGSGDTGPGIDNVGAFEITIYEHGFFYPGDALYTERFDLADTGANATGRVGNGVNEYTHTASLASAFEAQAGTQYWVVIAAELTDSAGDGWLWADAQTGDGTSASLRYSTGRWSSTAPYDSAFELITVPAPAATALLPLALMSTWRRTRP